MLKLVTLLDVIANINVDSTVLNIKLIKGEDCVCELKQRMFLTHETFSAVWYPLLLTLGIYCLIDGLLSPTSRITSSSPNISREYNTVNR